MDGSGAGKSASYVIPNACQALGSYVFTDPKGELYDKTAGYLKNKGYKIKVLNLVRPQKSDGYNPLYHIKNEIDVDVIANTIVKGQGEEEGQEGGEDDNLPLVTLKYISVCQCCKIPFDNIGHLPYLFKCGHFFCKKCISQQFTGKEGIIFIITNINFLINLFINYIIYILNF